MRLTYRPRHTLPITNRRLFFAVLSASTICAKVVRIYANSHVLSSVDILRWSPFFSAQDSLLLLLLRLIFDKSWPTQHYIRSVATTVALLVTIVFLGLAAVNISFFIVAGSEIHWSHIGVVADASGWKMMVTAGSWPLSMVLALLLFLSWMAKNIFYETSGLAVDIISRIASETVCKCVRFAPLSKGSRQDIEDAWNQRYQELTKRGQNRSKALRLIRVPLILLLLVQLPMLFLGPSQSALSSLSWTLPFTPFIDAEQSSTYLDELVWPPEYDLADDHKHEQYQDQTALDEPPDYPWLPSGTVLSGFEDWYRPRCRHYNLEADPFKISNVDDELLLGLRGKLSNIDIRHVMLIVLESTRGDIFPVKRKGNIWNRLAESYPNNILPAEPARKLLDLTPTANFLAGDRENVPGGCEGCPGRIRASKAFSAATYTLKSLVGIMCGISPLAIDFNAEVTHHIYQPCLPQVLQAFNKLDYENDTAIAKDFSSYEWKSLFLQSVTESYDRQDALMPKMGYSNETFITKEYLRGIDAKYGTVNVPDINYYGMPEDVLKIYMRDAFANAKLNNERLFLTHLTSTSHHPFDIPLPVKQADQEVRSSNTRSNGKRDINDLSKYLNAISYVDHWVGTILDILDEYNVAEETLLVFVGDHGIALPEGVTPYQDPSIGNFHVPLFLSHPKLPDIEINDAVTSRQILPTILDLLRETQSLSDMGYEAAGDLLRNYEGQSLLRPLRSVSPSTGRADWQFTVINPGGSLLSVRDAREPQWRLIVPLSGEQAWRLTNLNNDPYEEEPVQAYDLAKFLALVRRRHELERIGWVKEAVSVTRWWVHENRRRWRYGPLNSIAKRSWSSWWDQVSRAF
ncbi:putative Alkaline-phosphatase-like protein [Seiridium cardinale]|uniref:Alkaline-phosphatase-like protein n=1 Tax=Seiridium cardinale TaxID=138064 RepID=A0ABR2XHY2_9PEZI